MNGKSGGHKARQQIQKGRTGLRFQQEESPVGRLSRTPARELDDYIRPLPLSQLQNDHLIKLIIDQVNTAERGAFIQGFKMAMDIARS